MFLDSTEHFIYSLQKAHFLRYLLHSDLSLALLVLATQRLAGLLWLEVTHSWVGAQGLALRYVKKHEKGAVRSLVA